MQGRTLCLVGKSKRKHRHHPDLPESRHCLQSMLYGFACLAVLAKSHPRTRDEMVKRWTRELQPSWPNPGNNKKMVRGKPSRSFDIYII